VLLADDQGAGVAGRAKDAVRSEIAFTA
jgi:hypothetical protein